MLGIKKGLQIHLVEANREIYLRPNGHELGMSRALNDLEANFRTVYLV